MIEAYFSKEFEPYAMFAGVLIAVIIVFAIEITLSIIAGFSFGSLLESLAGSDPMTDTTFSNWLLPKNMPLMMAVLSFFEAFGAAGLVIQFLSIRLINETLPNLILAIPSAVVGIVFVNLLSTLFNSWKITHTTALPSKAFIGRLVTMLSETAYKGYAGEAMFTDEHGQSHYVMIEPISGDQAFKKGDVLEITERQSESLFSGVKKRSASFDALCKEKLHETESA